MLKNLLTKHNFKDNYAPYFNILRHEGLTYTLHLYQYFIYEINYTKFARKQ